MSIFASQEFSVHSAPYSKVDRKPSASEDVYKEIKHGLTNGYLHPLSFSKKNNCVHTVSEKKDKS